jgi:hypothetical protein
MQSIRLRTSGPFRGPARRAGPAQRLRACLACAIALCSASTAAAESVANAAPIPAPIAEPMAAVAPEDLERIWGEAVNLERTSWDLDESEAALSYKMALEAARRFEGVGAWLATAEKPDVEPYRHAYWRTARAEWLAADSLDLAERDRRRVHLTRSIEYSDRGLASDPECAPCMLWKFNAMGRRQQIDGILAGARNVGTMAKLLSDGIALNPDFREGDRSSTLGNLHYVSAIFYRVLPDWFWLEWIVGVRGDKERALEHARTAFAMHESRIDYRIEVGSQLLCLGASKNDPKRLAEGRDALALAATMRPENLDDSREIAAAHVMIAEPKKACSYAGAEWIEIDETGAVAAMK